MSVDTDAAFAILKLLAPNTDFLQAMIIEGKPMSKARPRFRRDGKVYASPEQVAAEQALGWKLKEWFSEPIEGNLAVACIFYRATKQRVDVDNMLKHVMDSANGIIWHDDSQVTAQVGVIEYDPERPRTVVVVARHESTMERTGLGYKEATCANCGKAFRTQQHYPPKFCSRECNRRYGKTDLSENVPCAWCKKPFKRISKGSRFCSNDCRMTSLAASTRDKARQPSYCHVCSKRLSKPGYKLCGACWLKGER